jgi:hypothetical protein
VFSVVYLGYENHRYTYNSNPLQIIICEHSLLPSKAIATQGFREGMPGEVQGWSQHAAQKNRLNEIVNSPELQKVPDYRK